MLQIKPTYWQKIYLVRFLGNNHSSNSISLATDLPSLNSKQQLNLQPFDLAPNSISMATPSKAGKAVRTTTQQATFVLVQFNVKDVAWNKLSPLTFNAATEKFASGGFRHAFKAHLCGYTNLGTD